MVIPIPKRSGLKGDNIKIRAEIFRRIDSLTSWQRPVLFPLVVVLLLTTAGFSLAMWLWTPWDGVQLLLRQAHFTSGILAAGLISLKLLGILREKIGRWTARAQGLLIFNYFSCTYLIYANYLYFLINLFFTLVFWVVVLRLWWRKPASRVLHWQGTLLLLLAVPALFFGPLLVFADISLSPSDFPSPGSAAFSDCIVLASANRGTGTPWIIAPASPASYPGAGFYPGRFCFRRRL